VQFIKSNSRTLAQWTHFADKNTEALRCSRSFLGDTQIFNTQVEISTESVWLWSKNEPFPSNSKLSHHTRLLPTLKLTSATFFPYWKSLPSSCYKEDLVTRQAGRTLTPQVIGRSRASSKEDGKANAWCLNGHSDMSTQMRLPKDKPSAQLLGSGPDTPRMTGADVFKQPGPEGS
jgi:hypothetical protein